MNSAHCDNMRLSLLLLLCLASFSLADITGRNPGAGSCPCLSGTGVNIRGSPCGSNLAIRSSGSCYTYRGSKQTCSLRGTNYEFFNVNFGSQSGWIAGRYLDSASSSRCSGSSSASSGSGQSSSSSMYTCDTSEVGKRINEGSSPTRDECRDKSGGLTCKGGQCVALVKCRCRSQRGYVPHTSYWRPGLKVTDSAGRCNRNIPSGTAIATFNSQGRYANRPSGNHAAVFMGCDSNNGIRVYHQYCNAAIHHSTYTASSRFYNEFYTISSTDSSPHLASTQCRSQSPGNGSC